MYENLVLSVKYSKSWKELFEIKNAKLAGSDLKDCWRKWKSSTHQWKNIVFEHHPVICEVNESCLSFRDQGMIFLLIT